MNLIELKIKIDGTKFLIKFGLSLIKIALGFEFLAQFGRRLLHNAVKFLIKFTLRLLSISKQISSQIFDNLLLISSQI